MPTPTPINPELLADLHRVVADLERGATYLDRRAGPLSAGFAATIERLGAATRLRFVLEKHGFSAPAMHDDVKAALS